MAQGSYGTRSNPLKQLHAEQWVLETFTSDPSDTDNGIWLRTDLDSGDRLATIQWDDGSGVAEAPVFPAGDSGSSVEEVLRVQTPNGLGFVSVADVSQYAVEYPQLRLQHNGTIHSWHDALAATPNSVVYQARVEEFSDPWPFNIGDIDMTVNGLSSSSFSNGEDSVAGDGTDDYGLADIASMFGQETFGTALTIATEESDPSYIVSTQDSNTDYVIHIPQLNSDGEVRLFNRVDNTDILVNGTTTITDGNIYPVVINVTGPSASDVEIYVDDMTTDESSVGTSGTVDRPNDWPDPFPEDLGFWARNNGGTLDNFIEADIGIFEFNNEPYSESDRQDFVSRRPEVA